MSISRTLFIDSFCLNAFAKILKKNDNAVLEINLLEDGREHSYTLSFERDQKLWIISEYINQTLNNIYEKRHLRNWLSYIEHVGSVVMMTKQI